MTERIFWIYNKLKDGGTFTLPEYMEKFEVSPRTAKRDLEYARSRCHINIVFDRMIYRYRMGDDGIA